MDTVDFRAFDYIFSRITDGFLFERFTQTLLSLLSACFKDKHLVSCYLRPDFLLNYIALSARRGYATKVFDQLFPTLIGVSLSHHVPKELSHGVHQAIHNHKSLSPSRVRAIYGLAFHSIDDRGLS